MKRFKIQFVSFLIILFFFDLLEKIFTELVKIRL